MSNQKNELWILLGMTENYSNRHGYKLQAKKSMVVPIYEKKKPVYYWKFLDYK